MSCFVCIWWYGGLKIGYDRFKIGYDRLKIGYGRLKIGYDIWRELVYYMGIRVVSGI